MFQVVFGVIGATVGSIAVAIAYLFWPLPSVEMDWRQLAETYEANQQCELYRSVFIFAPVSQFGEMAEYLEGGSIDERCPDPNHAAEDELTEQEKFDVFARSYERRRSVWGWRAWFGLLPVRAHMRGMELYRRNSEQPLRDYWSDLTFAARCEYWFHGEWIEWLLFRTMAAEVTLPRDVEVARHTRARECVARIDRQIASRPNDTEYVESLGYQRIFYDAEVRITTLTLSRDLQ